MKKYYILAAATIFAATVNSQVVVNDFESITLAPETYNNGSGGEGGFFQPDAFYENNYDTTWGSWTGFSISNTTDVTTAGWGNQYSAYTGGGYNSDNYAVYYLMDGIQIQSWGLAAYLDSFKITNTTYAAISMRDGDAVGKQFGSPNDANGQPDGTNGEDFFKLWIIAEYVSGQKDSIEFYLADYTFVDSLDDYIVDEWVNVDLTPFTEAVTTISFKFESSDVGQWGINTPTYFAMDDFHFTSIGAIDEEEMVIEVFPNPASDKIKIVSEPGLVELIGVSGSVIGGYNHTGESVIDISTLDYGIYYLKLSSKGNAGIKKFVKL